VSSKLRPIVVPGKDTNAERYAWQDLIDQATRWKYPLNYLLVGREITVAGLTWEANNPRTAFERPGASQIHASLVAVNVHGDFTKDEGLANHIIEVKGWFDLEEDDG
jgi:hypothetical protein